MTALYKVDRLAGGRLRGGRRALCLIALVLTGAGCNAPTTVSSPQPSDTSDAAAQAGRVAVQYATALFAGDINTARSLVAPGSRQTFEVVALGVTPSLVQARGLAVGRTTVTGDKAVTTLLGDLCRTTSSAGSASADCISNHTPTSNNPVFKVDLARRPKDRWLVTLSVPGEITPPVITTPS